MRTGEQRRIDLAHRTDRPRGRVNAPRVLQSAAPKTQSSAAKSPAGSASFGWRVAGLMVVLCATLLLAASQLAPVWSTLLRERLAARELVGLEKLENYQLSARFDDWLSRGDDGLTWTVRALTSSRPGISYFAEQALLRERDDWRTKPPVQVLPRMLTIARELSNVANQLPVSRRPFVRRLVQQFAEHRAGDRNMEQELIAACDRILALLPAPAPEEVQLAENEARGAAEPRVARSLELEPAAVEPLPSPLEDSPLEVTPLEVPAPEIDADGNRTKPLPKSVPKRFFAPRAQELPTTPVQTPENVPLLPPADNTAKKSVPEWVAELADLEVMRLLHHGDYGVRYTAERELDRRGYAREHLIIAKQLVHPDPRERKQLAEQLPRMTNVDPRPWLLQLSEDDDPGVRRTAEGILQASKPGREAR